MKGRPESLQINITLPPRSVVCASFVRIRDQCPPLYLALGHFGSITHGTALSKKLAPPMPCIYHYIAVADHQDFSFSPSFLSASLTIAYSKTPRPGSRVTAAFLKAYPSRRVRCMVPAALRHAEISWTLGEHSTPSRPTTLTNIGACTQMSGQRRRLQS